MKNMFLKLTLVLIIAAGPALANSNLIYTINQDEVNPASVIVSVDTSNLELITVQKGRQNDKRYPTVLCVTQNSKKPIVFNEPSYCEKLIWKLSLKSVKQGTFDPSLMQNSIDEKGQWIALFEFGHFARIDGLENTTILCFNRECQPLSQTNEPPNIVVTGLEKHDIAKGIVLQTDLPELIRDSSVWLPTFHSQLHQLLKIYQVNEQPEFTLVFFEKDRSSGFLSGVSGRKVYLSSVGTNKGRLDKITYQHLLKVAAHEMSHDLMQWRTPVWVNESLAEYYAQLSLKGTPFAFESCVAQWKKRAANDLQIGNTPLYEAQMQVSQKKQYQYYGLFYTKGPAFWEALDNALSKKNKKLMTFLPLLNQMDDTLPVPFTTHMRNILGNEAWETLEAIYLL